MARGDFPSAKQDQFMLRFPDGMRELIRETAEKNGRSMNAELIEHITVSLNDHKSDRGELVSKIRMLQERLAAREKHTMEQDLYWHNIAIALNRARSTQLIQFKAAFRHILTYKDKIPDDLREYCQDLLSVYENELENLPDMDTSMKFLVKQAEDAHNLVYQDGPDEDDPDFIIDPPKK